MKRGRVGSLLAVACVGVALVGCGGSGGASKPSAGRSGSRSAPPASSSGTSGASSSSEALFVRRANGLCAAAGAQITRSPPLTASSLFTAVQQEREIVATLVSNLKRLTPPPSKRQGYLAFLDSTQAQIVTLDGVVRALRARRVKAAQALASRGAAQGRASNNQAASIGLRECAKDYSAKGIGPTA